MSANSLRAEPESPERIDVYLSGGGYRAALGAIGVFLFLWHEGHWQAVRRIVSVSGGGIVNAHLALQRPAEAEVAPGLVDLFDRLTSRRRTVQTLAIAVAPFLVVLVGATWLASGLSKVAVIIIPLSVLAILLSFVVRFWLHLLFRGMVGTARLDDLGGTDWTVEHPWNA